MVKQSFWLALLSALVVLVLLVSAGNYFENLRFSQSFSDLDQLSGQLNEAKTALLFFETFREEKDFCSGFVPLVWKYSDRTFELGQRIEALEKIDDVARATELKKTYTLFLLDLWLYAKNIKVSCPDTNISTVLYFYSNKPGEGVNCKLQGYELDAVKSQLGSGVWIFAVDGTLGLDIVDAVKEQFHVSGYPALVFNEQKTVQGYLTQQQVLDELRTEVSRPSPRP